MVKKTSKIIERYQSLCIAVRAWFQSTMRLVLRGGMLPVGCTDNFGHACVCGCICWWVPSLWVKSVQRVISTGIKRWNQPYEVSWKAHRPSHRWSIDSSTWKTSYRGHPQQTSAILFTMATTTEPVTSSLTVYTTQSLINSDFFYNLCNPI